MKLASFHSAGLDRVGLEISPGTLIDVVTAIDAAELDVKPPLDMLDLIRRGAPMLTAIERARAYAVALPDRVPRYSCNAIDWHAPVRSPSKVVCLALNNRALDAIKIKAPTDHPAFFLKPSTALTGHLSAIQLRECYGLTHPEPELGVVIAQRLKNVSPQEALRGVFGYTIVNDVTSVGMREEDSFSVRYFKPGGAAGTMSVGEAHTTYPGRYKASDTFAPMGPFVVTADEVPDPAALKIECRLGERLIASDHTRNYVWGVPQALSHISRTMTLLPGDIVSMGTAVGGDADDPDAPHVPGVTRINLVGAKAKVSVTISRLGTLVNSIQML